MNKSNTTMCEENISSGARKYQKYTLLFCCTRTYLFLPIDKTYYVFRFESNTTSEHDTIIFVSGELVYFRFALEIAIKTCYTLDHQFIKKC